MLYCKKFYKVLRLKIKMEEANTWFKKAEKEFQTAKYNIKGNEIEAGAFFLQQSAEKALKALLIKKTKELIKTHDLVFLAKKISAPKEIIEKCQRLTVINQQVRYPDIPQTSELKNEIEELIKYTEDILRWTKKNL